MIANRLDHIKLFEIELINKSQENRISCSTNCRTVNNQLGNANRMNDLVFGSKLAALINELLLEGEQVNFI